MRLYRDSVSSLASAEVLAIACDMAALASATMFACGARSALLSRPLDVVLLGVWCLIPRALARLLQLLARPSSSVFSYLGALGLGVALSALLLGGWETIHQVTLRDPPLDPVSALPIFLGWCSAIALFHPGAYLLHDFLLWGIILVGLKDGRQDLVLWLPLFFFCMFGSSSARRLVHDTFAMERRPLPNLQNALVSSVLGTAAAIFVFGLYLTALGGPGALLGPPNPTGRRGDLTGGETSRRAPGEDWEPASGRHSQGSADAPQEAGEVDRPGAPLPVIGLANEVSLGNLSGARFDPTEVLRARAQGPGGRSWRPSSEQHWRALCLLTYDAQRETWVGDPAPEPRPWPPGGRLPLEAPASARQLAGRTELLCRVVGKGLRTLLVPELSLQLRAPALEAYRLTSQGDIFPDPPPQPGNIYFATVAEGSPPAPSPGRSGEPVDRRLLQVPPDEELGLDLRLLSARIFTGARPEAASRIEELRSYFSRELTYSLDAGWRPGESALPVFLERERRGDCTHFATAAALLLRTAGIPTRVIAGFLGARWDETTGEAVVINGTAHAWIEVLFPGDGWHVVDPTAWVDVAPGTQRVPGALTGDPPPGEVPGTSPEAGVNRSSGEDPAPPDRSVAGAPGADGSLEKPSVAGGGAGTRGSESARGTRQWIRYGEPGRSTGGGFSGPAALPTAAGRRKGNSNGTAASVQSVGRDNAGSLDLSRFVAPLRTAIAVSAVALMATLVILALRRKRKEGGEHGVPDPGTEAGLPGDVLEQAEGWLQRQGGLGAVHDLVREYVALQRALALLRAHRRPHQTPREHARLLARRREDLSAPLETMNRALYAVLYDGARISVDDALEAVECCRRLRRGLG